MYFFNALTAVAKREEEQGRGGELLRGGVWSWLWFPWHACERSSPVPSSRLGLEVSGSHRAEKVGERRGARSISSNASDLQGGAGHSTPFFTLGLEGRKKEDWRMKNPLAVARQQELSAVPGVTTAATSQHYEKHYVRKPACLIQVLESENRTEMLVVSSNQYRPQP